MANAVLDASAILALLNGEMGAETVMAVLGDSIVSAVNYAEVVSKLIERGGTLAQARTALEIIDLAVSDFDVALAERVATLRAETRHLGLSLADRACLALAERENAPAFTADRSWQAVASVEVVSIR
jgi:PIN domain nuclease of toxin-antitoxin system